MHIEFRDLLVLKLISELSPSQRTLYNGKTKTGVVNKWLEDNHIDRAIAIPYTGTQQLMNTIALLRALRLLTQTGAYRVAENGMRLLYRYPDWKQWPHRAFVVGADLVDQEKFDLA